MIILRNKQFSIFDKLRELGDKYEKWKNPNYKTQKEILEERSRQNKLNSEREEKEKRDKFCAISRQHKILMDIYNKVSKYHPTWGDGDEYPCLELYYDPDYHFGEISIGDTQSEPEYKYDGKSWIYYNHPFPKTISNLKSELINRIDWYIKEWRSIDYLDAEDIEEVLVYLSKLKDEIKRSSL